MLILLSQVLTGLIDLRMDELFEAFKLGRIFKNNLTHGAAVDGSVWFQDTRAPPLLQLQSNGRFIQRVPGQLVSIDHPATQPLEFPGYHALARPDPAG